ncbi:MAG: hypothetical protein U9R15_04515 [Chloroflexota bacterium]|nr:hypothetical protein [Chloroflexota bacterium]
MLIVEKGVLREVTTEDVISSLISKTIKLEKKVSRLERKLNTINKKERR